MSDLQILIEEYEQKKKELVDNVKDLLRSEFDRFFQDNPAIKFVTWTQYFDENRFSVNEVYFSLMTKDEIVEELTKRELVGDEAFVEEFAYVDLTRDDNPALLRIIALIDSVPYDIMMEAFGADSEVTITPEAINIEDYSQYHD